MTTTALPTENESWGFWGTMSDRADRADAWTIASGTIAGWTGCPATAVRDFLDSRYGRHFADDCRNELFSGHALATAIDRAVTRWMGWQIDRKTSRDTGIPHGLPYLAGLVTHFEILAEA